MFCTKCGTEVLSSSNYCGSCGAVNPPPLPSAVPSVVPTAHENIHSTNPYAPPISSVAAKIPPLRHPIAASEPRPWVRYWARMMDIYLAAVAAGVAIGFVSPDALSENGSDQLFALVVFFAWIFIESLLLSTIGTTPGKWLLKTRIVLAAGTKPDYSAALSRSLKVWWRGLGIGFPIVSLITLIVAHNNLTKNSVTSWDKEDGFVVVHERIGPLRIVFALLFFIGFIVLMVAGSM